MHGEAEHITDLSVWRTEHQFAKVDSNMRNCETNSLEIHQHVNSDYALEAWKVNLRDCSSKMYLFQTCIHPLFIWNTDLIGHLLP